MLLPSQGSNNTSEINNFGDGYIILNDGKTILQYGISHGTPKIDMICDVTFVKPFPNACLSVSWSLVSLGNTEDFTGIGSNNIYSINQNGFSVSLGGDDLVGPIYWMAIGY